MPLNIQRLKKVQRLPGRIIAQCPACAAAGHDKKGEHLVVYPNGAFGCVVHPGDKAHRKAIWAAAGHKVPPTPPAPAVRFRCR